MFLYYYELFLFMFHSDFVSTIQICYVVNCFIERLQYIKTVSVNTCLFAGRMSGSCARGS